MNDSVVFQFRSELKNMEIPIISLYNNDKCFNFIVDTGSSTSAINRDALEELDYQMLSDVQHSIGIEGISVECEMCGVVFHDAEGSAKFVDIMSIVDMNSALDFIDVAGDLKIHGLIGSSFLKTYKGILNYEEKTVSLAKYRTL